jgi:hypothetical protein
MIPCTSCRDGATAIEEERMAASTESLLAEKVLEAFIGQKLDEGLQAFDQYVAQLAERSDVDVGSLKKCLRPMIIRRINAHFDA